jgi:hypothetical protein
MKPFNKSKSSPSMKASKKSSTTTVPSAKNSVASEFPVASRQTTTRSKPIGSNWRIQDLPEVLEPFDGWTQDPTDEEVDALVAARKCFSYDHSFE